MEKNISLAYQEETNYYADKVRLNSNTLDILDYIGKAGYDNYEDYYVDLQEYLLKIQNYEIVEEPEINANIPVPYISSNTSAFLYAINCNVNYAFVPNSINDYTTIESHGYTPVKLGYESSNGPILSCDGDLRIYLMYPATIDISYMYFSDKMSQLLSNHYEDVSTDNNDVMVNGKKVIGGASTIMNNMRIVVFQINFVDKLAAIQDICGISDKVPGHIDSSVISPEEFKNEFLAWLRL